VSENTSIEWCDHTWSPVWGCTEISKAETGGGGCDNCYARVLAHRFGTGWNGAPMREFGEHHWNEPLRWDRRAAAAGVTPRVFPSMCDPFDKNWPPGVRTRFFELIERTPNLIWLLLTKRIGNVARMLEEQGLSRLPSNVWLGATVVNQAEADRDIPKLLQVPAANRFLSMEPLLGPVNLSDISDGHADSTIPREYWEEGFDTDDSPPAVGHNCLTGERWQRFGEWYEDGQRIDWVIVGGESGPGARPMHPDWARGLRDQCQAAGVPFLFKQWGEWAALDGMDPELRIRTENNPWQRMDGTRGVVRVGKKAAGRLLDGRTWDEVPA